MALLKITRPVPFSNFIQPITLAPPGTQVPQKTLCWVTGWGDIRKNVPLPRSYPLQEVDVRIVDTQTCRVLYDPEPIGDAMLCAGQGQGRKSFCDVSPPKPSPPKLCSQLGLLISSSPRAQDTNTIALALLEPRGPQTLEFQGNIEIT
ncbi:serine protease 33-like [Monodelphis domestica]|uniref:serine protease 33-like n=1 Tax=Monodelphis domestica TaxID=13616 RepID=UPI0024E26021|nr:serine protease 33-like [Monodelphis domestica]